MPVTLLANYLLHAVLGLPLPISTALAVEIAIVTNFIGNNAWTFANAAARVRRLPIAENHPIAGPMATFLLRPTVRRFLKFNAVSLVGLAITTGVTWFLADAYAEPLRQIAGPLYFLVANLAGIGVAMSWNFLANVVWTWR